jgi:DNA-binding transcriptional LysR family regulator
MNITSRQLKAFLLTAQHQSFSRAAEQLFITQSGMSVLVRGLEEQLGFRLFDRTTRRVTLTQSGAKFLPIADQSLVALESAVASIGNSASESGHDLRIGATPLVAAELLPVAIAQYAKLRPKVKIRLFDIHRPRLIEMVQGGEIDVGLTAYPHPAPGLSKVPLVRFSLMLVAPQSAPYRLGQRVRWADIAARKLIAAGYRVQLHRDAGRDGRGRRGHRGAADARTARVQQARRDHAFARGPGRPGDALLDREPHAQAPGRG